MTIAVLATQATDVAANEVAARQAQMTGHVAAADPHGDRKLAWLLAGARSCVEVLPGTALQSLDFLAGGMQAGGNALGTLVAVPGYSPPEGMVLRNFVPQVIVGAASSLYHVSVWQIDNQGDPYKWVAGTAWASTLIADVGAIDCSTTSPTALGAITVPGGIFYCVAAVMTGALATITVGSTIAGLSSVLGSTAGTTGAHPATGNRAVGLAQTGVAAGAAVAITPTGVSAVGHGLAAWRSS